MQARKLVAALCARPAARLCTLLAALACLAWTPVSEHDRAVELLVALSSSSKGRPAAKGVTVEDWNVPGVPRARVYRSGTVRRTIVLSHGVHAAGIDEPRFVRFATELAKLSIAVVTPALPSLSDYRVSSDSVALIARTVQAVSAAPEVAPTGKVGLIGISFGGGLSLVAAARDDVKDRLEYVTSIGGHHDLGRVLRFLLTNRLSTPEGERSLAAHEYGPAVLTYGYIPELVPEPDRAPLQKAFRAWLVEDRATARSLAATLATPDGRDLFSQLEHGTLSRSAPRLMPLLEARKSELERLSPSGKLGRIGAPVYLLHGSEDRVIPPTEVAWAARELQAARAPHRVLVTSLIEHVTPDRPASFFEKLALVDFMASML